jgi:hypothetical protein
MAPLLFIPFVAFIFSNPLQSVMVYCFTTKMKAFTVSFPREIGNKKVVITCVFLDYALFPRRASHCFKIKYPNLSKQIISGLTEAKDKCDLE